MEPDAGLFAWLAKVNIPMWVAVPLVVVWAMKDKLRDLLAFFFLDAEARAAREDALREREEGRLSGMVREYLSKNAALLRENGGLLAELKAVRKLLEDVRGHHAACEARCEALEARVANLEGGRI